jgi:hypothetical protein
MLYQNHIIYGPYTNNENRRFVVIIDNITKSRKTLAYAKYLMELHLNRYLTKDETVDHIDRDKTNDVIENLQIIDKSTHTKLDIKRVKKIIQTCITCGIELVRSPRDVRGNAKKGKAGPFCRSCSGKYGSNIQKGLADKLPTQPSVKSEYYYLDKTISP